MKFDGFQVTSYRNIVDSGWIDANQITAFVGQNEAGKSNLFEALYCLNPIVDGATYSIDEDWPVDQWEGKDNAKGTNVCIARFLLDESEIADLFEAAQREEEDEQAATVDLPDAANVVLVKSYGYLTGSAVHGFKPGTLDKEKAHAWVMENTPKFVLIHDYEMTGAQIELDQLKKRLAQAGGERHKLSDEDQTILVILDLAKIDLHDFVEKGATAEGRTIRSFDKRSASRYLTQQFASLWQQKNVKFEIEMMDQHLTSLLKTLPWECPFVSSEDRPAFVGMFLLHGNLRMLAKVNTPIAFCCWKNRAFIFTSQASATF
jgi:hypothetical protein